MATTIALVAICFLLLVLCFQLAAAVRTHRELVDATLAASEDASEALDSLHQALLRRGGAHDDEAAARRERIVVQLRTFAEFEARELRFKTSNPGLRLRSVHFGDMVVHSAGSGSGLPLYLFAESGGPPRIVNGVRLSAGLDIQLELEGAVDPSTYVEVAVIGAKVLGHIVIEDVPTVLAHTWCAVDHQREAA